MTQLLQLHHVTKKYKKHVAIDDITLNLPTGKIIGLLGPNGSGKTTLIKLINGLLQPTTGDIVIDGYRPSVETKKIVSYLPDTSYLRENMKIKDTLTLFEDFYTDFSREQAEHLLDDLGLNPNEQLKNLKEKLFYKEIPMIFVKNMVNQSTHSFVKNIKLRGKLCFQNF